MNSKEYNPAMTKICMLSTGHDPLDDRIYYKETLSLAKRYPSIILVMPGNESDFTDQNDIEFLPLQNTGSLLSRLLAIPKAIKTIAKIKPQICHFHDYELIFALPFLKLFTTCKTIYDVHEVYPEMVNESEKLPRILTRHLAKFVNVSEKMLSRLADCIVTSDENISERFYNVHPHVTTLFNYPRLSMFIPDEAKVIQLQNQYQGRTPIIYHGSISEKRGLYQMIGAMEILRRKRSDIILLIVGGMESDLFRRTKEKIREKGLEGDLELIGWVPHKEIVNYITISKLGLVPFLPTEKFKKNIPIKQFEYMACGVPVLGADLPPISSYIRAANCGKVYDSDSVEALAFGVINILQDELEWRKMAEAGKKAIKELWNWDQMEKKLFDVYEKLLQSH